MNALFVPADHWWLTIALGAVWKSAVLDSTRRRAAVSRPIAVLLTATAISGVLPLVAVQLQAGGVTSLATQESQAAADGPRMTVTGLVVDHRGNPIANAAVMIYTQRKVSKRPMLSATFESPEIIGQASSDGSGRFRVEAPRTSSATHDLLGFIALADGHGIGIIEVDPDTAELAAKIRLREEFVIEGRLFDVQGQPAQGAKAVIRSIRSSRNGELEGPTFMERTPEPLAGWPKPATTDASGHFKLRGLGPGVRLGIAIDGARFATQNIFVEVGGGIDPEPVGVQPVVRLAVKLGTKPGDNKLTMALEPAQTIAGRVTYADTGRGVPHAPLSVFSRSDGRGGRQSRFETDMEGRFRINPQAGDHFNIATQAPVGQPYLALTKNIDWPKGAVEQSMDFALPRGIVIRGKVTEQSSGNPVRGAVVRFTPYTIPRTKSFSTCTASLTSPDGLFQIACVAGPGYVVVQGPSDDFVLREFAADGGVFLAQPGNRRFYAHAYKSLDVKPSSSGEEVNMTIERGLTVKGRLLGPDDQPVQDALMLSRIIMRSMPMGGWKMLVFNPQGHAKNGRFELHGLDPASDVAVHFLDPGRELGATIQPSGKTAQAGPLDVRLERCGTAKARLVDAGGKPVTGQNLTISLIVTPGVPFAARDKNPSRLVSNEVDLYRIDARHYKNYPASDGQGQIVFPALIPGAPYRLIDYTTARSPSGPQIRKEFSVKPGETLELGDILIERPIAVN
jgi:protocatechuate 3,4-dioxygenase beta subunit